MYYRNTYEGKTYENIKLKIALEDDRFYMESLCWCYQ